MASNAAKARRRAEALNELNRLSGLLADKLGVEVPDVQPVNSRDPELAQIQQVEAINGLLTSVLEASGVEVEAPKEEATTDEVPVETSDESSEPVKTASKKSAKNSTKKKSRK